MPDYEALTRLGKEHGFTHVGKLLCSTVRLMPEVRQMCEQNTCRRYGTSWSCPPGCGTLEECQAILDGYREGLLVQTVGELEDSMDVETMLETEALHKEHFLSLEKELRKRYPGLRPVSAGSCTKCKVCTYPDAPCRFPEEAFSSMEAFGMLVTQVCQDNGMQYYYGPNTIVYTSCYLLE